MPNTPVAPPPPTAPAAPSVAAPAGARLAEVLAALSYALDLADGQSPGATLRSCVVGLRLADELGLPPATRSALYYALLLKDAGSSGSAAGLAALRRADGRLAAPRLSARRPGHSLRTALRLARDAAVGGSWLARVRRLLRLAPAPMVARQVARTIRAERGAEIARRLGLPAETAEAIRWLDEHWGGRGHADGLRGEAIPLLSRIALLARTVERLHTGHGVDAALAVAGARRGRWFDPRLVDRVLAWRGDPAWWALLREPELLATVVAVEPHAAAVPPADEERLAIVAHAFADIVDARSPYTLRHSANVAVLARGAAGLLGLGEAEAHRLYLAGLLHDLGKLGVPTRILDKPERLTEAERAVVERHPLHTWAVLSRARAFADIARPAALHHERLDGSGYPWGVPGEELDVLTRLLVVSDVYEALTADRPYRRGMTPHAAVALLHRDRGTKLCPQAIDALVAFAEESDGWYVTHPVAMRAA
ncbi:MAG TPA: HD domain-containing phosphohydrolase [Gemmatimonadaceae bacterium]|nr:HD domain-containing phosphohydrolase [Gemmatimonadaceae bacterium]